LKKKIFEKKIFWVLKFLVKVQNSYSRNLRKGPYLQDFVKVAQNQLKKFHTEIDLIFKIKLLELVPGTFIESETT
jgi:hypothetical protein